jgi:hypothetical protein
MPNFEASSSSFTDSDLLGFEILWFLFSSIVLQFSTAFPQSRERGLGNNSIFCRLAGVISRVDDGGTATSVTNLSGRSSNLVRLEDRELGSTGAAVSLSPATPQQIPTINSN